MQFMTVMQNPSHAHWEMAKTVLKYLKQTIDYALTLGGQGEPELSGYSDADFANDVAGRKSVTGLVFTMGSGAISRSSKKQSLTALSTAEAEYIAVSAATQEALWLRAILRQVGRDPIGPTTIRCDNQAALELSKDHGSHHARTKHIDIRHHFVRDHIRLKNILLVYCPTDDQTADILTKALTKDKHRKFTLALGLSPA